MVYTPKNVNNEREEFKDEDVRFSSDYKDGRYKGYKGHVYIKGKKHKVYGIDCSLPNCTCDEKIVEV